MARRELVAALNAAKETLRNAEEMVLEEASKLSAAQEGAEEAERAVRKAEAALAEHQGGVVRGIGAVLRRISGAEEEEGPEEDEGPEVEEEDAAQAAFEFRPRVSWSDRVFGPRV